MAQDFLVNPRQFRFELVGPEKTELTAMEERVILPGEQGDLMMLAGHELLLAALRSGVVSVIQNDNKVVRYFIDGGFADIGNTHCTILSPSITPVVRIVVDQVTRAIETIDQEIAAANDNAKRSRLERDRSVLLLKLEAAEKYAS